MDRGMKVPSDYPQCHNHVEMIGHLLMECDVAKEWWEDINCNTVNYRSNKANWEERLMKNLSSKSCIWLFRNATIHGKTPELNLAKCTTMANATKFFVISHSLCIIPLPFFVGVSWKKPRQGWCKPNTDRSSIGNLGKARAKAFIRNHENEWVVGSYRHIPKATSVEDASDFYGARFGY
ncbi:reverse transcriptase [Gossypium australe]|uniref:Reverse transcriptase n=1 Tax=Gossypium australe TaxID=47621 RepID=A0A5B6U907_9ROSI|nr:reverse transcriptase [Gossypium australe]